MPRMIDLTLYAHGKQETHWVCLTEMQPTGKTDGPLTEVACPKCEPQVFAKLEDVLPKPNPKPTPADIDALAKDLRELDDNAVKDGTISEGSLRVLEYYYKKVTEH